MNGHIAITTLTRSLMLTALAWVAFGGRGQAIEGQARPGGGARSDIEDTLQRAAAGVKENPRNWKKIGLHTAGVLDGYDAKKATNALYAHLRADGPDGGIRAMVSCIARTTRAFEPDAWLALLEGEQDPFLRVAGMQIFSITNFKAEPRFRRLLKRALSDTRAGRRLVGEEGAYADKGLRVCDTAYNMLVSGRADRPPEAPLDVAGDEIMTRNRLIMTLCKELGVAGPLPGTDMQRKAEVK